MGTARSASSSRRSTRRFGSEVTIIELLPRLVPVGDEAISAELEKSFKKAGIKALTGTKVTKAAAGTNGVDIEAQTPDGRTPELSADLLLVCDRTRTVTAGLGVEEAGIAMEKGYVKVDDLYRTSVPTCRPSATSSRWAAGVHPQLAHVSSAEGISSPNGLRARTCGRITYDHVPSCTYCDPEIGSVGLTEAEASRRATTCASGVPRSASSAARRWRRGRRFVKIVADRNTMKSRRHMIGPRSTELVAEAVLALRLECTVEELIRTIHAHPTFSEAVAKPRTSTVHSSRSASTASATSSVDRGPIM